MLTVNAASGFGSGGGGDKYWANVVLLLGMEGADTSTTFTDESGSAHGAATVAGNAQVVTAVAPPADIGGSGVLKLDGSGDYLEFADSADWILGSAFTIEFRIRPLSVSGRLAYVQQKGASNQWLYGCNFTGGDKQYFDVNATGLVGVNGSAEAMSVGTWYSWALDYDGTTYRIYQDGVVGGTSVDADAVPNVAAALRIGSAYARAGWTDGNAYISELRITTGVARYAGAYTVLAERFPRA